MIPKQPEDQIGLVRWEYDSVYGLRGYRFSYLNASSANVYNGTLLVVDFTQNTSAGWNKGYVDTRVASGYRNMPAGVGQGTALAGATPVAGDLLLTPGNKGWVQFYGYHPAVLGDSSTWAAGARAVCDGTTNVLATQVAAGTQLTYTLLGMVLAAVNSTPTYSVKLMLQMSV